jgi:hypothetical protein
MVEAVQTHRLTGLKEHLVTEASMAERAVHGGIVSCLWRLLLCTEIVLVS